MSPQDIGTTIAACAAFFSALSAAASWYNSSTFYRQLKNTTVDACVGASSAMKAAVYKTIELKGNREDNVTPEQVRGAYEDAWTKWVAFDQAFRIAQRYNPALTVDAPDQTSRLLSGLRANLRDPDWIPGGANDPKDIRAEMDGIVQDIQRTSGLAA